MRDILYLARKGVPFEHAMGLSPTRRMAYCVAIGEFERGGDHCFDWNTGRWPKPE